MNETDSQSQTAKAKQKPKQSRPRHSINDLKNIKTFSEIMSARDEHEDYIGTALIEFKQISKIKNANLSQRNFLKNQAFALMMHGGFSTTETAHILGLPLSTVSTWRAKATEAQLAKIEQAELKTVRHRLANVLNSNLSAVEKIVLFCSDPDYLKTQTPDQVERLFNMSINFSMKLIEAQQRMEVAKRQINVDADYTKTRDAATMNGDHPAN